MSFVSKIVSSQSSRVVLLHAREHGKRPCYFYVLVDRNKMQRCDHLTGQSLDIRTLGKIIESGYGDEPPATVKERMQTLYKFE